MLKVSLKRYFITGLLVIVPIWGTILVLKTLFVTLDGLLGSFLEEYFPHRYVPGEVQEISTERVINVYVPTSPNPTSGYLLFVPESELIPVSMSVDEAMKMMFSGGMYTPRVAEAVGAGPGRKR